MLEAGRRFLGRIRRVNEQPVNPHESIASEIISEAIDSLYIEGYSSDLPNVIVHLGRERIGREVVSFERHADGGKHLYFIYFFDVLDPDNPKMRVGLKADQKKLQTYYTGAFEGFDQFIDTNALNVDDLMIRLKQTSARLEAFRSPKKVEPNE